MSDVTRFARNLIAHSRTGMRPYRLLLQLPGAPGFFFPAAVARWGIAMTGLGLLWTARGLSGSFAIAGMATGAFALAEAIVGPQVARFIDRYGQTVVVPFLLGVHAAAIATVVVAAGTAFTGLIFVGAVSAGSSVPQFGALSAARWTHLVPERGRLRSAFSLEAIVNDVVFLSGPPIVTLASSFVTPYAGTVVAAALVIGGGIGLTVHRRSAPQPLGTKAKIPAVESLLSREFVSAIGVTLGLGCFFGTVPVMVTAYSTDNGFGGAAGVLMAVTSIASLASGIAYGAMNKHWQPRTVQFAGAIMLASATALMAGWVRLPTLLVGLFLAGAMIAPLNVSSAQIIEAAVERRNLTQGFTWINTASATGIAAASAIAGVLIEINGIKTALLAAFGLVLISPLSAAIGVRAHRRSAQSPQP